MPTGYDQVTQSYDYFIVKKKDKFGVCDASGKEMIPCKYGHIQVLPNNKIRVTKDEKSALFDGTGNLLVGWLEGYVDPFEDQISYSHLSTSNGSGVVDMDFNIVVEPKYSWIEIINNQYFEVTQRNGNKPYPTYKGVIDNQGNIIVPIEIFDEDDCFSIEYDDYDKCLYYYNDGERYDIYQEP